MSATEMPALAGESAVPVIDTHVHLFDPRRPQGVPYSGPEGQPGDVRLMSIDTLGPFTAMP